MKIIINQLAKMEGHASFKGHLFDGKIAEAKIDTEEGARLIEGILIGRKYWEAPIITARICGICPVVHALTAIEALENAFKIKVSKEILVLRKIMATAQIIHSHTLHLFFLSIPDFYNEVDDLKFIKKYPVEAQAALNIRKFATEVIRIIGGRTVHPISTAVGGFKNLASKKELRDLLKNYDKVYNDALLLFEFIKKLPYPKFARPTEFISLSENKGYGYYGGVINVSNKIKLSLKNFYQELKETNLNISLIKNVKFKNKSFMVGALARINNNRAYLNKGARRLLNDLEERLPSSNTFYNVLAQSLEVVHFLEESKKLMTRYLQARPRLGLLTLKNKYSGKGLAAVEAPRGLLIHYYEVKDNLITNCNIITPTAQFLNNLEEDLKAFLPQTKKLTDAKRRNKIKTLIRAYDPCISCATH